MSQLTLYTNPQSRGQIAHWMLEELGEPYDTVWLDYGPAMKAPAYLAINPMGKVPALRHGEAVVTETAAICTYLAECFPDKGLIPALGTTARANFHRWMYFAAGPLEQAVTAGALGWQVPPGRNGMAGFGSMSDTLGAIENLLNGGPFALGEAFSALDVYLGSAILWGLMFKTVEKRPVFEAYAERLVRRPAYQRVDQICSERNQV